MVQPGDLILVRTPGAAYRLMRALAAMPYDHIGVVMAGDLVLNVVRHGAVLTPIARMLEPARAPKLLRPVFPDVASREAFLSELSAIVPCRYDALRGAAVVALSALKHRTGLRVRVGPPSPPSARRHICSEAILGALARAHPAFPSRHELELDRDRLGVASMDDFFTLARARPDILRELRS